MPQYSSPFEKQVRYLFRNVTDRRFGAPSVETEVGGSTINEIQKISLPVGVTGGTFTITWDAGNGDETTTAIPYDATAAEVQTNLENLTTPTGGDFDVWKDGKSWLIEFTGEFAATNVNRLNIDLSKLKGDTESGIQELDGNGDPDGHDLIRGQFIEIKGIESIGDRTFLLGGRNGEVLRSPTPTSPTISPPANGYRKRVGSQYRGMIVDSVRVPIGQVGTCTPALFPTLLQHESIQAVDQPKNHPQFGPEFAFEGAFTSPGRGFVALGTDTERQDISPHIIALRRPATSFMFQIKSTAVTEIKAGESVEVSILSYFSDFLEPNRGLGTAIVMNAFPHTVELSGVAGKTGYAKWESTLDNYVITRLGCHTQGCAPVSGSGVPDDVPDPPDATCCPDGLPPVLEYTITVPDSYFDVTGYNTADPTKAQGCTTSFSGSATFRGVSFGTALWESDEELLCEEEFEFTFVTGGLFTPRTLHKRKATLRWTPKVQIRCVSSTPSFNLSLTGFKALEFPASGNSRVLLGAVKWQLVWASTNNLLGTSGTCGPITANGELRNGATGETGGSWSISEP